MKTPLKSVRAKIQRDGVRRRITIDEARVLAKKNNGKCISKAFIDKRKRVRLECANGHRWIARLESLRQGRWCSECGRGSHARREEAQRLARARGGKVLSNGRIRRATDVVRWQCRLGHSWAANIGRIRRGSWCPDCDLGVGERICRIYFEYLFKSKFPSQRPFWLRNPSTDMPLELDGYNKSLKLAFEHHGVQHYRATTYFASGRRALKLRQAIDKRKRLECARHGIKLIEIPSVPDLTSLDRLPKLIESELKRVGVIPKRPICELEALDLSRAFSPDGLEKLEAAKKLATEKGGHLLSQVFLGSTRKHRWKCGNGHIWDASIIKIRQGRWCLKCSGRDPWSLAELDEFVFEKYGGHVLSKRRLKGRVKLKFQCKDGHVFSALILNVVRDHWCPKCAVARRARRSREKTMERFTIRVKELGGVVVDSTYLNSKDKVTVKCSRGHLWAVAPNSVLGGSWCKKCATLSVSKKFSLPLAEVQKMVAKQCGKLIESSTYVNGQSQILVECIKGHRWFTSGVSIRSGRWCPKCASVSRGVRRRISYEYYCKEAERNGGRVVSSDFLSPGSYLQYECGQGHIWLTSGASIRAGSWCSKCADLTRRGRFTRKTEDDIRSALSNKNIEWVSGKYRNQKSKLTVKCNKCQHVWVAHAGSVTTRSGCPNCYGNIRLTIDEMKRLARERGGECLSDRYINAKTPLKWRCGRGHEWLATSDSVKNRRTWCKKCFQIGGTRRTRYNSAQ